MTQKAYRSQIFHLLGDPYVDVEAYEYFKDGLLIIEDGHVKAVGPYRTLAKTLRSSTKIQHYKNHLIMPGFIDTHIHFPQVDIIGSYGRQLLDWLQDYTFPAEMAFKDPKVCAETAKFFVRELLRNGTTSALVFGTVHEGSADALFLEAQKKNMRLIAGKVLMDRGAPKGLLDGKDLGRAATKRLIKKWHGTDRLGYAITPRFAPTSTSKQLAMAGVLKAENPTVHVHTHMCENKDEIKYVGELFPDSTDYLDVYAKHGLVGDKTVLAHGVHLSTSMCKRISTSGAAISLCPTSNMFIGSGLFNLSQLRRHKIRHALGTDIGGGTSFSLLATMNAAYSVCQLRDLSLSSMDAFYMATLGGAKVLGMDKYVGNFEPGKEADFVVMDLKSTPLIARRLKTAKRMKAMLFAIMIMGDDRMIAETFVMGRSVYKKKT
ncbi:MAG: guanine deaminase [Robiginitomaculum sp.]|nr:MAG: guanine deaminase [Robiginitomaculum sp.]